MRLSTYLLAGAMAAAPLYAAAQVSVNIQVPGFVAVAPPAPRFERVPSPRPGQVWVQGHWVRDRDAYDWRQGYWQPARADHVYAPGRWIRADGGWRWVEPDWRPAKKQKARHRDRDDRHDRHDRRDDHRDGDYHCPPGQAKKGRC